MTQSDTFAVTITTRHNDCTDPFKTMVQEQVTKLGKYYPTIMDAKVLIDKQHTTYRVEISVQVPGSFINGTDSGYDLERTLDSTVDKVKVQLKKLRDRIVDHKAPSTQSRAYDPFAESETTDEFDEVLEDE